MPQLTDKYGDLESGLVPLIIEGINTWEFIAPNPRGYPNVSVSGGRLTIACQKSDKDSWLKKLEPLQELFKEKTIPIRFGENDYISEQKESPYDPEKISTIYVNVNLIELDRLLEGESSLYKMSGKRNALYKKGNPQGLDYSFPFNLIDAINNTIFEKEGYPVAYVVKEKNNAFCLVCDAHGEKLIANEFYSFYLLFEDLCKKHGINPFPNSITYATSRVVPNSSIIKYEFNISPADMEKLLFLECPNYAAYKGGASIQRLVDPAGSDIKDGVLCLFPAALLPDEQYIPRNAGCNMSEIISVQLANYIKKYVLADTNVAKEDFFGHHNSKLTEDFLKIDALDIFDALAMCMGITHTHHQIESGTRILTNSDTPFIKRYDLDDDSRRIYQRYAVVAHAELEHLQSCEISILSFLDKLLIVVENKKQRLSKPDGKAPSEYTKRYIEQAKTALLRINELKKAIINVSDKKNLVPDIEDFGKPRRPSKMTPMPRPGSKRI